MLEAHTTNEADHALERPYPIYRVNFWARDTRDGAHTLDAWYLTGVDSVLEALGWVHAHSRGRAFELFAEADDNEGTREHRTAHLVRLAGRNPNEASPVTGALRVLRVKA